MRRPLQPADEGLAAWVERWAPSDTSVWNHWRESLPPELRSESLFPLQVALSGLRALRSFENQSLELGTMDFREHLHAACATYAWALRLSDELRAGSRETGIEPLRSLDALRVSLADAAHVSERLLELHLVDAGAFHSSCDMFLRDIGRNDFFRPPRALEVSNDAFFVLLRCHRFVGVAVEELGQSDGTRRAVVALAAVRRDLRELTHALLNRGDDDVAAALEPALSLLDAEGMLPGDLGVETDAPKERMRGNLRDLRHSLKSAAKRLRSSRDEPEREEAERLESERVPVDLSRDVWAFRLIVRAFLAKATAASLDSLDADGPSSLAFIGEFVGHFRVFGPRLAKGTEYAERGPLIQAVTALSRPEDIDTERLAQAVVECERFAEHLEQVLSEHSDSASTTFDKERAAEELRGYLEGAKRQPRLEGFG